MYSRRTTGERPDPDRADAAARRLALIAADLGSVDPPTDEHDPHWWADHTRVASPLRAAVPAPPPPPVAPDPPPFPVPGRHAARRRGPSLAGVVLIARGRLPALAPAHVAVVALALAVALAVTAWLVVRDDPAPVAAGAPVVGEPLVPVSAPSTVEVTDPSAEAAASASASVTVDVAGKVRRPGIVVLDQGARVTDALEAAGGAKRGVDLTALNLARVLVDGEQIVVGAPGSPGGVSGAPPPSGGALGAAGPLVNLNLATQAELEGLPQVGPVTAQAIIAWRDQQGGFTSVDELLEVDGIGEKTLARLAPLVSV